jgi:predicted metalloprotease with PDZ domain
VWVSNVFVEMRDVAYRGIYFLRPEVFAPDSTGRPPSVIFVIGDLNHPKDQVDCEIEPAVASRAWNDFLPYFRTVGLGNVPRADATKRFASLKEGFCDAHDCSGGDAVEYGPSAGVRLAGWVVDGGGVLVGWVPPASRTWRAGLRPGDVIVKTDGHAASDVQGVVFALSQGAALPRLLIRRQDRLAWLAEGSDSVLSGLQVTSESAPSRVRVRDVRPGSVIATAGLRSGDYIVSIDGQPAATVEGLDDLLQRNRTGHWRLGIRRGSDSLAIAL